MNNNTIAVAVTVGVISLTSLALLVTRSMGGGSSTTKKQENQNVKTVETLTETKAPVASEKKYPLGKLLIYFGSQTGTAEGFARTLMNEAKSKGFDAGTVDLEDFDPEEMKKHNHLVIFLMATYGEGEATDNAANFYKWLVDQTSTATEPVLPNLKYCVFGLGNKQYEHFNRMGKVTDKHLSELGAQRVMELVLGDDDGALEDDFENWRHSLFNVIAGSSSATKEEDKEVELVFKVLELSGDVQPRPRSAGSEKNISSLSKHLFNYSDTTIGAIRELRTGDVNSVGSTLHVELKLPNNENYETADNLAVIPENDSKDVEAIARILGFDLDKYFEIKPVANASASPKGFKKFLPTPMTVREALTFCLDIHGQFRTAIANSIVAYVTDSEQKAWLKNLLQKDNKAEFKKVFEDGHESFASLLQGKLSSIRVSWEVLLHILPVQQPRYYTISSSSSVHPHVPHITVAIAETKLDRGLVRGVCSRFLVECQQNTSMNVRAFIKESTFRLPFSLATPVILIGPGTGFAPMRALLQERQFLRTQNPEAVYGNTTLYFGCKKHNVDHIYEDEMKAFVEDGTITSYQVAYSRETANKVYVQHLMQQDENAKALWADIQAGGYIFVCGATGMGSDVNQAIINIAVKNGLNQTQAELLLKEMKDTKRYIQELWN